MEELPNRELLTHLPPQTRRLPLCNSSALLLAIQLHWTNTPHPKKMSFVIEVSDAEALHLAREELFSYTRLIFENPPTTLAKTIQLTSMLKKMLDEANNLHVIDFDFTPGLGSLDPSLKRKKSFLSPTKKRRSSRKNSGLETDLNDDPSEYEPFESRYLNKRGRHRSNNVVSMVPAMQQSPTVAITQDQREMQDHPTLPAMPGIGTPSRKGKDKWKHAFYKRAKR